MCRWLVKYDWVKRIKTSPDYHTTITTTTGSSPTTFPIFQKPQWLLKKGFLEAILMYQNVVFCQKAPETVSFSVQLLTPELENVCIHFGVFQEKHEVRWRELYSEFVIKYSEMTLPHF